MYYLINILRYMDLIIYILVIFIIKYIIDIYYYI